MPLESPQPGSTQDWLRYAASDLGLAKMSGSPNILLESLCYHAQQCAEKSLKAVLVAYHVPVRKTHSIGLLLDLVSEHTLVPGEIGEATILTDYAVMGRYPGDAEPITELEYGRAIRIAEAVLVWARQIVG